ncbi:MAG: PASTA domain-containing protein, partial [Gaiellales bacterium]
LGAPSLPGDVLARLDGRLAGEPGLAAPRRGGARRRRPRLALVVPGFGVALAAAVAIAVLSTQGSSPTPSAAPQAKAFEKLQARPAAPKASATAGGQASDAVVLVRVPALVGRSYPEAKVLARRLGLRLVPAHARCATASASTVAAQSPRAGAHVAGTSAIRVRQRCGS